MVRERLELELTEVPLKETVEEVVNQHRQLMEQKRVAIELDFRECPTVVVVDRRRLIQVFDNLILNAVSHMGEFPEAAVRIGFADAEEFVVIGVSDNGIGIPAEYHDRIFSRFFRVPGEGRKSGTGLGLAIVKTIVESHGGTIWVESGVGGGAVFKFTLPKIRRECQSVVSLNQALH
jgi:two-component system OmpR family sensor kinase